MREVAPHVLHAECTSRSRRDEHPPKPGDTRAIRALLIDSVGARFENGNTVPAQCGLHRSNVGEGVRPLNSATGPAAKFRLHIAGARSHGCGAACLPGHGLIE